MQNDNELRGLPADIDILIAAASAVVRGRDAHNLDRRIDLLERTITRVKPQYKEIFEKKVDPNVRVTGTL